MKRLHAILSLEYNDLTGTSNKDITIIVNSNTELGFLINLKVSTEVPPVNAIYSRSRSRRSKNGLTLVNYIKITTKGFLIIRLIRILELRINGDLKFRSIEDTISFSSFSRNPFTINILKDYILILIIDTLNKFRCENIIVDFLESTKLDIIKL